MSKNYESQQSRLLNFSEMQNEGSSQDAHFIHQLHQKYGIPLVQLENIYAGSITKYPTQADQQSELDYGQKLVLNHNILKEMITIIDNKEKMMKNHSNFRYKSNHNKNIRQNQSKLDEKLQLVKIRLEELVRFIAEENQRSEPIQIKKIVNLSDINQGSIFDSSLQYSKDFIEEGNSKEKTPIVIDQDKLNNAKEATSQFLLGHSLSECSNNSPLNQIRLKSSLDRISEVQSGQTIEKQEDKNQKEQMRRSSNQQEVNVSNPQIEKNIELDETGRIILSTINKKTVKVSTITQKQRENSKQSIQSPNKMNELKSEIQKSRFWRNKSGKLEHLPLKTAVSHQIIEQTRALQRSRFKYDQFNHGFTFKSLDSIDKHEKESQSYLNNRLIKIQTHQLSNTSKPKISSSSQVRNSQTQINQSKNSYSNHSISKKDVVLSPSHKNIQRSVPIIKESNIIQTFPSKTLIRDDQPINRNRQTNSKGPRKQIEQNQRLVRSPQETTTNRFNGISMSRTAHFLSEDRYSQLPIERNQIRASKPQNHQVLFKRPLSVQHLTNKSSPIIQHPLESIYRPFHEVSPSISKLPHNTLKSQSSFSNRSPRPIVFPPQLIKKSTPLIEYIQEEKPYLDTYKSVSYDRRPTSLGQSILQKIIREDDGQITRNIIISKNNLNDRRLKKKGIQLTNQSHSIFYNNKIV